MTTRIAFIAGACVLLMATSAAAQGVIAGQTTEVRRIERPMIGSSQYVTTTDGRRFAVSQKTASALVAMQLLLPEAIVALPEAAAVGTRSGSAGAPVIAASVPRGVEPVPVVVIERGRGLDGGRTTNVFPGEVVAVGAIEPGTPLAIVGGAPVVREDGYYFRGTPSDRPRLLSIPLDNGRWVTIEDRIERMPAVIEGGVRFDPAALVPGAYVRVIRRDDGTYFLGTAPAPRETYNGVPAGKVSSVDPRAKVIELSDGSLVYPEHRASAVLRVGDAAIDASTVRPGMWLVIDPSPGVAVEAPSAFPADLMAAGRVMQVR